MSTKRKRSSGTLFTPSAVEAPTPTPVFTSPVLPNFFTQSKTFGDQPSPLTWKQNPHQETLHQEDDRTQNMNSRTRKRYRDSRPQESQIHASTVQKLFQAQKAHPQASPVPSHAHTQHHQDQHLQPQCSNQDTQPQPQQKSTLHSFWQLPAASQTTLHGTPSQITQQEGLTCEGCDRVLVPEYGMDTLEAEMACRGCGKCVCGTCAITAEVRLCLDCAMQA